MEKLNPDPKQVNLAAKQPVAYMLVVALLLLAIVSYAYFTSNNNRNGDCNAQNKALMKRIERLEAINDNFVLYNFQRDRQDSILRKNTDSLIRTTIGKKVKQLSKK